MLFHGFGGMTKAELDSGTVRAFTGTGTPFLKTPGLKELRGVRIGRMELPLTQTQKFPSNADFSEKVKAEWPLVTTATDPEDGCPTLLRSVQSNDGIWQEGATIYISGAWEKQKQG